MIILFAGVLSTLLELQPKQPICIEIQGVLAEAVEEGYITLRDPVGIIERCEERGWRSYK